uniref:Uncharacterized protein n=1 Tax=Anguilla anguilla TaxID=7936 RepID=A0A0E9W2U8_ANGAN
MTSPTGRSWGPVRCVEGGPVSFAIRRCCKIA